MTSSARAKLASFLTRSTAFFALAFSTVIACSPESDFQAHDDDEQTDAGKKDDAPGSSVDGNAGVDANLYDASTPIDAPSGGSLGTSAGCGKAGAATGLDTRKVTIGGKARTFLRFVPASYDPKKPLALVYGLHGSGGTAAGARSSFDLEAEAKGGAIFVYPQALPYDPNFPGDNRWDATKGSDDYAFIDAVQADVEATHCIDKNRVYVAGFSNGARMSALLGCYRGDKLRAVASLAPGGSAGTLPFAGCVGEVAVITGVGDDDAEHQPSTTIVRNYYTGANSCTSTTTSTTPKGCAAYQGCGAAVPTTHCSYPGGHAWPPIGAAAVWNFFDALK